MTESHVFIEKITMGKQFENDLFIHSQFLIQLNSQMGYTCFWTETFFKHPILLNYESCLHFLTIFTVSVDSKT